MTTFKDALKYLSGNDIKLGKIINLINPQIKDKNTDDFTSLVKIIIGQQLSGSAATTIVGRLDDYIGNKNYNPINITTMTNEELRLCGLSNAKVNYVKGFAQILLENPNYFKNLKTIQEKEILDELCKIRALEFGQHLFLQWAPYLMKIFFLMVMLALIKQSKNYIKKN